MPPGDLPVVELLDLHPSTGSFLANVMEGLTNGRKRLSCMYFYDRRGSELFDQICETDEYYLTRTELAITEANASEMASLIGVQSVLIEFGSGSSLKTRLLLDRLEALVAYVPVDISKGHLLAAARALAIDYPHIPVRPVCADFMEPLTLPDGLDPSARRVVYFPGSTIGNFPPTKARKCLAQVAKLCGPGGGLLLGTDLKKDRARLEAAYNDADGVTAAFNLNLLARINRELGADFQCDQFQHKSEYNEDRGRIESSLVSLGDQVVTLGEAQISFDKGEEIVTEYSQKYSRDDIDALARVAGFEVSKVWTDPQRLFSVQFLTVRSRRARRPRDPRT